MLARQGGLLGVNHVMSTQLSAYIDSWIFILVFGNLLFVQENCRSAFYCCSFVHIGSNFAPYCSASSFEEGGCTLRVWTSPPSKVPAHSMSAPVVVIAAILSGSNFAIRQPKAHDFGAKERAAIAHVAVIGSWGRCFVPMCRPHSCLSRGHGAPARLCARLSPLLLRL